MNLLAISLIICTAIWCVTLVFLIYSIGAAILTLNFQILLTGIIIFAFATLAEFILGILND